MVEIAIDSAFIQSIENRPKLQTLEAQGIPLIDLTPLNSPPNSPKFRRLVAEIGGACEKWGFFQVINHGVPEKCRERVESAAREFFGKSKAEKMEVGRDEKNPFGYYDTEHTKNVRDWKEVFDFGVENPMVIPASYKDGDSELLLLVNQWPRFPTFFREACDEYTKEIEKLTYKLLELISESLGLQPKRLNGFFKNQTTFMRMNYYPVCPVPHLALGVGRHKDAGAMTVITQDDVGGLEVKRKSDGEWVRVKPTPNAYVVNVGDIIQVWSNDKYESVEHRVMVNSERERFSVPFFFNPAHDVIVEPLQELTDHQNLPKYKPYNWGKFIAARNLSNFKKLDVENIQIHHFKASE
jgi:isopenicillin N synthase-like dioxygenase